MHFGRSLSGRSHSGKPLETLYFGGGTPSLLPIDEPWLNNDGVWALSGMPDWGGWRSMCQLVCIQQGVRVLNHAQVTEMGGWMVQTCAKTPFAQLWAGSTLAAQSDTVFLFLLVRLASTPWATSCRLKPILLGKPPILAHPVQLYFFASLRL